MLSLKKKKRENEYLISISHLSTYLSRLLGLMHVIPVAQGVSNMHPCHLAGPWICGLGELTCCQNLGYRALLVACRQWKDEWLLHSSLQLPFIAYPSAAAGSRSGPQVDLWAGSGWGAGWVWQLCYSMTALYIYTEDIFKILGRNAKIRTT